ncbi:DUF397 domain-containing protein [Actinomadura sp. KC06]|uniref:DUF397 domain-containing protein n=1 Tax=Actinomadura sp. KC06 TaxID=2530369 RepID=UPI00104DF9D3|nr:DUF397 domain-containing protein [Actinomadura sp. KC06]TDD32102.1 DUF397 domain-containing protein [Actinomadura sp. KC06]
MNTPVPPRVHWHKSTHSGAHESNCVEIADFDDHIAIRDSKSPHTGHIALTRQAFATLLTNLTAKP